MTLKNWSRRFARACGTISLLACGALAAQTASPLGQSPAIALLDAGDAAQWQTWAKARGWRVIVPAAPANQGIDARVEAAAAAVQEAIRNSGVDPARVYLAGRGGEAAAVFYAAARAPDLWAAALALGGSPQPAIDSGRIFTANLTNTPILWVGTAADQAAADKLRAAGINLEWRPAAGQAIGAVFDWLAAHTREAFPLSIDCETDSPAFARCYWIQMTRFDASERNDVLPTTLAPGSSGASLDLGAFSFKLDDPGPGVAVILPEKYSGPLKPGDRIVSVDGKAVENARRYTEILGAAAEEKPAAVMVQRGKDRTRIETRIVLPQRGPFVTARVQGTYVPEEKELRIITRTIAELRVTVPPHWVPATLYWNGLTMEQVKTPGCMALRIEKELLHAEKCP
jgi:predicted esterase